MSDLLRRDLFSLCALWDQMLDLPRTPSAHTTGRTEAPTPVPIAVLSLRREAGEQLAAWAHLVAEEQHLNPRLDLRDVVAVCRFLDRHADFLAHHEAGLDAKAEVATIARQVEQLVRQTRPRRFIVGSCPECTGLLVALLRNSDALLPSELRCSLHPEHCWTPSEWNGLGVRIHGLIRDEAAARRLAEAIAGV